MKHEGIFHFLGACVIAAAIVISAVIIADKIPGPAQFPSELTVSTGDSSQQFGDYLSTYEASAYLGIATDSFMNLIHSGQLDSAIYQVGKDYIISKQALQDWVDSQIGS